MVANMSNNNYDLTANALSLAKNNMKNVVGFITQRRITCGDLICMTPGISNSATKDGDQQYRQIGEVDTDLWKIHLEMVQQAQASRAELVKTAVSAVTGLADLLKP